MFNPSAFENSRPDGISLLELVNPEPDQPRRFVPLQRTDLRGEIIGPLASLRLTQVYRYPRKECDKVLEAVYRFPLPGDAAVTAVQVRFGEVEIRAELKERAKAEKEYTEAKEEGRQAALLTRESPDVFTLQVAGIQPDQDVTVTTSYVQLARTQGTGWSLRIPLTTSPRYVREDETGSRHASGQPLFLLRDPGHRFALDLSLFGSSSVQSPTHDLAMAEEGDKVRVRLKEGEVLPDRDCVLSWQPAQDEERPTFQVLLHDDTASNQVYFLALLAPPKVRPKGTEIPREVVLLVDHSGSMEGPKWEAADWAVKQFLSELNERDSFALGVFHDRTTWLSRSLAPAEAKKVEKAIRFLEKNKDSGGTELGVALEQALDLKRSSGEAARHVLLITDAEVSDEGRILRLADQEGLQPLRRRIDVLCIDAAPNSFLAHELAERGGGVAKFLTSAPEEEDITTALDDVLADWAQPVVTGLRLVVDRPDVEAAGHAVIMEGERAQAIDLGDLPAGRSLWVAGRVQRGEAAELSFRVLTPSGREVGGCRLNLKKETTARPALKALFGARRLLGLEYLISSGRAEEELLDQLTRLGYDPKEVLADQPRKKKKIYAENVREDANRLLRRLLVRESLNYGLACSETAFVAVRTESGKPIEGTVYVANALPTGWSDRFLGGMRTVGMTLCCLSAPPPGGMSDTESVDSMLQEFEDTATGVFEMQAAYAAPAPVVPSAPTVSAQTQHVLFSGVPQFEKGEAVLFDTDRSQDAALLPEETTLTGLQVESPGGKVKSANLDRGLMVLVFVEDMAAPRARVRLTDLFRQGGTRPLNLRRVSGQRVRLVLADASGTWTSKAPALQVSLQWT